MLNRVRSHLSYANVVATGALFVALGGGAYGLTGVPDRNGVYRACADDKTGALRAVANTSSCRKAKTVKRGKRRIRIPGESAIAWNQQGKPGAPGSPAVFVRTRLHFADAVTLVTTGNYQSLKTVGTFTRPFHRRRSSSSGTD